MSSPTKQVSARRLPPLPNQNPGGKLIIRSPKTITDVEEREALLSNLGISSSSSPRISSSHDTKQLNTIEVVDFLNKNPKALENYIMESVSREQLERLLIRKIHAQKSDTSEKNSEDSLSSLSRWKFCVHTDKQKTLQHLTQEIHRQPQKAKVMYELVKCIAMATHADKFSLYLISKNEKEIYLYTEDSEQRTTQVNQQKIAEGTTVCAYVASTLSGIHVSDILGDERFPDGIGIEDSMAQSVICQPITQSDGKLVGIAELVRVIGNESFEPEDDEITTSYLTWGGITIHYAQIFKEMQRQKNLHNFLLEVIKSLFDEMDTVDGVITNVMTYAKKLVDADRCAMFLTDEDSNELHADLFDEGKLDENGCGIFSKGKEIRFTSGKGIAGYVASSGKLLNIKDAYSDPRFNREVDVQTGYTTYTILCVPMKCKDRVVGVVQLINKRKGIFTSADEHAFTLFAGYCGLAIRYSQIFNHLYETQQKHLLALDVLSFHCTASEKDVQKFRSLEEVDPIPEDLWSYNFNYYQDSDHLLKLAIIMAEQMLEACDVSIDTDTLHRFMLTVRKNYRPLPYHNWSHGVSVAHMLWLTFTQSQETFTANEKLGMFFGALCHDVDHRGYSNQFLQMIKSPIGLLYKTSTMEWHHLEHTLYLLQSDELNIFKNVEEKQHNEIIAVLKQTILDTDIALFLASYTELESIITAGEFNLKTERHRALFKHQLITGADLCGLAKPWNVHRQSVKKVYEEFHAQGDLEKKMNGTISNRLLDRDRKNEVPKSQVTFLSALGIKCYGILYEILPCIEPMLENVRENLEEWKRLAGMNENFEVKMPLKRLENLMNNRRDSTDEPFIELPPPRTDEEDQ